MELVPEKQEYFKKIEPHFTRFLQILLDSIQWCGMAVWHLIKLGVAFAKYLEPFYHLVNMFQNLPFGDAKTIRFKYLTKCKECSKKINKKYAKSAGESSPENKELDHAFIKKNFSFVCMMSRESWKKKM